jgi:hypothetical protein
VPVHQEVNARHGMMPRVTERRRPNMTQKRVLPHAAKRVATATMLLALLGTAGCCMTGRERVVSPALSDVASMTDSRIAPATSECEAFGCVP